MGTSLHSVCRILGLPASPSLRVALTQPAIVAWVHTCAAHGSPQHQHLCAASDASGAVRRGETPTQSVLAQLLQPDTPGNSTGTPMARDLTEALAALASDKRLMSTFQVSRPACLLQSSRGCAIFVCMLQPSQLQGQLSGCQCLCKLIKQQAVGFAVTK